MEGTRDLILGLPAPATEAVVQESEFRRERWKSVHGRSNCNVDAEQLDSRAFSSFAGCGSVASRSSAGDAQTLLDFCQRNRLAGGAPLANHFPKIVRTRQPQVFCIIIFDPNQHRAGPSPSRNYYPLALGGTEDRLEVRS